MQAPGPASPAAVLRATRHQGTDPQGADPQGTDPQGTDPQGTDAQGTDARGTDAQGTDPRATDPRATDPGATAPEATAPGASAGSSPAPAGLLRVPAGVLAERARAAAPRLGRTRLVCIDGPAGSGKTTLAGRLAAALGPDVAVVHMEDLYAGWTLTGAYARLAAGVLRPLAEGRAGGHSRYDWAAGRFAPEPRPVPPVGVLVVEGCGSCPRAVDPWVALRLWVEAPSAVRLARGLARDGAALAGEWHRWQRTEAVALAAERTRDRADLRLDGTAPLCADPG